MGKITAVEIQKHDSTRVSIYIDGRFFCGLYRSDVERTGLAVGRELMPCDVEELVSTAETDRAYRYALRFLTFRPRSTCEVERRLYYKGFSRTAIGSVIERLKGEAFLDDAEFARLWVRDRAALKPKGKVALIAELTTKGVAREAALAAVVEVLGDDEVELARRAVTGFETRVEKERPDDVKKKIHAFLLRRGFSPDIAANLSSEAKRRALERAVEDDP